MNISNWKAALSLEAIEVVAQSEARNREQIERDIREEFHKAKLLTAFMDWLGIDLPAPLTDGFVTLDDINFSVNSHHISSVSIGIGSTYGSFYGTSFEFRYKSDGPLIADFRPVSASIRADIALLVTNLDRSIRAWRTEYITELAG